MTIFVIEYGKWYVYLQYIYVCCEWILKKQDANENNEISKYNRAQGTGHSA